MKPIPDGQDAYTHPARFLSRRKKREGRAATVFVLAGLLVFLVSSLVIISKWENVKKPDNTGMTTVIAVSLNNSGSTMNVPFQFPAPKPDDNDPDYRKLKISLAIYLSAKAERSSLLPHEFEKMKEASRKLKEALKSFSEIGDKLLLLLLGEFSHEDNPARRAELMDLITRFCGDETAHLLLKHYNDLNASDRRVLVRGLSAKGIEGLEDIYGRLISSEKVTATKNEMIDYMLSKEDRNRPLKPRLLEMFNNSHDAAFRIHILNTLPRYGEDAEIRDFHESLLNKEELSIREQRAAMYSFARSHRADAVPQISQILERDSYELRASAIKALEYAGGKDALQILDDLAENDPDVRIRRRAATSAKILRNSKKVTPAVIRKDRLEIPGMKLKLNPPGNP